MVRRRHRQRLDERDAQREARLGVVGQALPGGAVDQGVEIGQTAQRLGGDGVGEGAVVGAVELARRRVQRGFERQALAQHRVEQAQGGAARSRARRVGAGSASSSRPPAHGRAQHVQLPFDLAPRCGQPEPMQTESPMAERPAHVKPPAYLTPSPPVPEPGEAGDERGKRRPQRQGADPLRRSGRITASAWDF